MNGNGTTGSETRFGARSMWPVLMSPRCQVACDGSVTDGLPVPVADVRQTGVRRPLRCGNTAIPEQASRGVRWLVTGSEMVRTRTGRRGRRKVPTRTTTATGRPMSNGAQPRVDQLRLGQRQATVWRAVPARVHRRWAMQATGWPEVLVPVRG